MIVDKLWLDSYPIWLRGKTQHNIVEYLRLMNGIVDPSLLLKPSLMTCDVTYDDVIFPHPMRGPVALGRSSGEEGLLRNACTGEFL